MMLRLDPVAATLCRLEDAGADGVDRARNRIGGLLARVHDSRWPEVADTFSWLTNTGCPIEFAWTGRDAAVRWTAEVAPPEYPADRRLALAGELAFGNHPPPELARIGVLQAGSRLRFGAWLGVRHRAPGDEAKVYAEVPEVRARELAEQLGIALHPVLRTVGLRSRMVGVLADGGLELYTRSQALDAAVVRGLEASSFGRADRFWPAVRALLGGDRPPRPSYVSIALAPTGEPVALTWFGFAKAVFGSDAETLAALAERAPSPTSRAVLAALAGGPTPSRGAGRGDDGRWRCGMVGVGVNATGEPWFQVGLRP